MKLQIADTLALPIEATTEVLGWLGRRGQGKSYGGQKLAEEFHRAGAQFVVLDPVGNWWGLRLAANGKDAGLPITIFGGRQGDVPLEKTGGKLVADVIIDRTLSAVIDVSQFESDQDKAKFAADFAARFYYRKKDAPSAVHLFLEEAQEFVPQNPQGGNEPDMLHAFTRIAKLGRNYGIGVSLLSQRPQEVNKKVLNLAELLFVFQLTGPQERKAVDGWISDKGIDEDIEAILPKLQQGKPHAWSPSWLDISRVVKIDKKWTFDASSTPKVGKQAVVRELAPIDIEKLRADMAATIERAKADDPKVLRQEIARLKAEAKQSAAVPVVDEKAIERAVRDATVKVMAELDRRVTEIKRAIRERIKLAADVVQQLGPDILSDIDGLTQRVDSPILVERRATPSALPARVPRPAQVQRARPTEPRAEGIGRPQQRILDALATLERLGIQPAPRISVAFFAGYTENGHFNNTVGTMNTSGLLHYPAPGMVELTDEGREHADADANPIASLSDLHGTWLTKLDGPQGKILRVLLDAYPESLTRAELAERAGYTENGHFNNTVGKLHTLGAADYPGRGLVCAAEVLFPANLV